MKLFPFSFWKSGSAPPDFDLVLQANASVVPVGDQEPVGFWPDLSPAGNDLNQTDDNKKPVKIDDGTGPGGLAYVRGDGIDDFMATEISDSLKLSDAGALLVLVFRTSQAGNDVFPFSRFSGSFPYGWALRFQNGNAGFENEAGWEYGGDAVVVDGQWHVVIVRWSNQYATCFVDGLAQFTVPRTLPDYPYALIGAVDAKTSLFTLGNGLAPFAGDIYEARAYAKKKTGNFIQSLFQNYAIAAETPSLGDNLPHICFQGDSLTLGLGTTSGMSYPDQLIALLGDPGAWAYENNGQVGATIGSGFPNMTRNGPTEWMSVFNHFNDGLNYIIAFAGSNDLATAGITPAQALTALQFFWGEARKMIPAGAKFVAITILPRSAAGDSPTFEADRQTLNAAMRAVPLGTLWDLLVDAGADALIGQAGDETNPTYYNADRTHLNDAGAGVLAQLALETIS